MTVRGRVDVWEDTEREGGERRAYLDYFMFLYPAGNEICITIAMMQESGYIPSCLVWGRFDVHNVNAQGS